MPTKLIFRVWSYYHRKYLPLEFKGSELYMNAFGHIGYTNPKNDNPCLPQDELEIELFTGFKDKNLTKIYEGDIVRFGKDEEIYRFVISFKNGCFNAIDEKECNIMPITLFEHSEYYTILGNIHENPELLESLEN